MDYCKDCQHCVLSMSRGFTCKSHATRKEDHVRGMVTQGCVEIRKNKQTCSFFVKKVVAPKKKTLFERIFNL